MKKALLLSTKVLACFFVFLALLFVYFHFGSRKLHFTVSLHPKAHFDQAATSTGSGDVTFHTLDGEPRHLAAYKGQVVILHRWGTWCAPCVAEMPAFQKLYDRYRNDPQVRFVVVASMNSPADVRTFAVRHHYDLPFYVADDDDDAGISVSSFPKTMFYAKGGGLSQTKLGATDWGSVSVIQQIEILKHS